MPNGLSGELHWAPLALRSHPESELMLMRILKVTGALLLLLIACGVGWITGLYQGVFDGKTAVFNERNWRWTEIITSTLEEKGLNKTVELENTGDGYVIIRGRIPEDQLTDLRNTLITKFGTKSAQTALRGVNQNERMDAEAVVP